MPIIERSGAATPASTPKYGITANLTADLTVNTDFAQVEVDEQQVNLTRFSLLFPEKRDFFLEGAASSTSARADRRQPGGTFSSTSSSRHAFAVLQPPHWTERRPRDPDRRRADA